ncbi:hypothetical protein [Actinomadura napierensis]
MPPRPRGADISGQSTVANLIGRLSAQLAQRTGRPHSSTGEHGGIMA